MQFPDDVDVTLIDREDSQLLELRVNPADMGKVIGRQGRIAKAIRTVMRAASGREGKKVNRLKWVTINMGIIGILQCLREERYVSMRLSDMIRISRCV